MATKEKNYTNDYCKLSAEEYDNLASNAKGIIFGYRNSKGEISGGMHFFGTRFQATAKSQDEILRTLKAVIKIHWDVSGKEADLRERNNAIRARLGRRKPAEIILRTDKGETVRGWDVAASEFVVGMFPTAKDLDRSKKNKDNYIHNAVIALLEALNFRVEFPKSVEKADEEPAENTAPATDTAEIKAAA